MQLLNKRLLGHRLISAAYAHMLLQRQVFNMTHTPRWASKLPCYCGLVFSAGANETSRHVRRLLKAALAGDGYVMRNMQGRDSERWSGCCERGPWTQRACCLQLRSMWFTVYKGPAGGFVMDGEAVWRPWRCVFVSPLSLCWWVHFSCFHPCEHMCWLWVILAKLPKALQRLVLRFLSLGCNLWRFYQIEQQRVRENVAWVLLYNPQTSLSFSYELLSPEQNANTCWQTAL